MSLHANLLPEPNLNQEYEKYWKEKTPNTCCSSFPNFSGGMPDFLFPLIACVYFVYLCCLLWDLFTMMISPSDGTTFNRILKENYDFDSQKNSLVMNVKGIDTLKTFIEKVNDHFSYCFRGTCSNDLPPTNTTFWTQINNPISGFNDI